MTESDTTIPPVWRWASPMAMSETRFFRIQEYPSTIPCYPLNHPRQNVRYTPDWRKMSAEPPLAQHLVFAALRAQDVDFRPVGHQVLWPGGAIATISCGLPAGGRQAQQQCCVLAQNWKRGLTRPPVSLHARTPARAMHKRYGPEPYRRAARKNFTHLPFSSCIPRQDAYIRIIGRRDGPAPHHQRKDS